MIKRNKNKVFIIAEAGVNHNGQVRLAKKLVDAAKRAGCDAVKFQIFKAEDLVLQTAKLADYQKKNKDNKAKNQYQLIKGLELSFDNFREIKHYCDERRIIFLATPFDYKSADLLEKLNVFSFKIPSGEVTNIPFLEYVARKKKPIILSTGMSNLYEVKEAVKTIYNAGNKNLILLHCVTEYPAPFKEVNLQVIHTMRKIFGLKVGYSDHTLGIEIPIAAVALGAEVIEKHLTLDRNLPGPDHKSSLEPDEFKKMVTAIRNVEQAMGDGIKRPMRSEMKSLSIVRRSLVSAQDLIKGQKITLKDLAIKRPGDGIPPRNLQKVLGLKVKKGIRRDTVIYWSDLT